MINPRLRPSFRRAAMILSTRIFSSSSAASSSSSFPLKHVTKCNFEAVLPSLTGHIKAADFVAIDLEMTGITSAPWRESFEFDRYDVAYLKVKDSAEKFAVFQFGVCPFRWDASKNSFVAQPHNFYIFPRQEHPINGSTYEFLCQTMSLDFLAKYQFDFNACIRDGVSYLSRGQEDDALKHLDLLYGNDTTERWHDRQEAGEATQYRIADILFTERMKNVFKEWRDGLLHERSKGFMSRDSIKDSKQNVQTIFFKTRPALSLNGFTSHQLRLIQLVAKKHFNDLTYVRMVDENSESQQLLVYTESKIDKDLVMQEVREASHKEAERKIKGAIGFRHVIDLLCSENKLIVGHNCFLDVAHIYNKFLGPLPSTAEEFVSTVHNSFPNIIDTKVLLNANNLLNLLMKRGSTSLSKAFTVLCPQLASSYKPLASIFRPCVQVEVQVDDMSSSNWNSGAKHEAGYDAFMTGCIFAQACSHLGVDFVSYSSPANLSYNEKIQEHINHLYLSWNNGDIIDLSTGKRTEERSGSCNSKRRYPKIIFSNIVLLWGFSPQIKAQEIREVCGKVFGLGSATSVYHLDDTAVFVQFSKEELVSDFLVLKASLEGKNDPISVLHPFSKLLDGGNTHAASYDVYKEICSSPISKLKFVDQADAVRFKGKTRQVETAEDFITEENECLNKLVASESKVAEKSEFKFHDNVESRLGPGTFLPGELIETMYAAQNSQVDRKMRTRNIRP